MCDAISEAAQTVVYMLHVILRSRLKALQLLQEHKGSCNHTDTPLFELVFFGTFLIVTYPVPDQHSQLEIFAGIKDVRIPCGMITEVR